MGTVALHGRTVVSRHLALGTRGFERALADGTLLVISLEVPGPAGDGTPLFDLDLHQLNINV